MIKLIIGFLITIEIIYIYLYCLLTSNNSTPTINRVLYLSALICLLVATLYSYRILNKKKLSPGKKASCYSKKKKTQVNTMPIEEYINKRIGDILTGRTDGFDRDFIFAIKDYLSAATNKNFEVIPLSSSSVILSDGCVKLLIETIAGTSRSMNDLPYKSVMVNQRPVLTASDIRKEYKNEKADAFN